jgi:phosphatidylglycerol lysyltransferase
MPDKYFYMNPKKTCLISYRISGDIAVALGAVAGETKQKADTLNSFLDHMKKSGFTPVFYNVKEDEKKYFKKYGMRSLKIGEEAVIVFDNFDIQKPELKDIRYSLNKFDRLGLTMEYYPLSRIPWSLMHDIDVLYQGWVRSKKSPPLTFSLNYYPFPVEDKAYVGAVYDTNGILQAAFSFFPYDAQKRLVLELMLRNHKAPNGTVEGALTKSVFHFKDLGYTSLSLGVAPLSNLNKNEKLIDEKVLSFIFKNSKSIYKYKSLFEFKKQFNPIWEHKYIIYPNLASLPKVALALARVHITKTS